ncbi:hypothetical protein PROFUN_11964 [Planoprotostelium fungivorum]|uniref:MORN repeat-containing protein n=1 Tax=Planoprotostelium fungivorum TaxID=1890364 RepID=A0A2P6N8Y0_9EUKA|nr:hypothetical protein PROFUN_11964 [Planoprotostelium fungivorum]
MGCGSAKVAVEPFEKHAATEPKETPYGSLDPFILQCLEAGYRTLSRTEAQAQLNSGRVPEEDDFGDDEEDYNETEPDRLEAIRTAKRLQHAAVKKIRKGTVMLSSPYMRDHRREEVRQTVDQLRLANTSIVTSTQQTFEDQSRVARLKADVARIVTLSQRIDGFYDWLLRQEAENLLPPNEMEEIETDTSATPRSPHKPAASAVDSPVVMKVERTFIRKDSTTLSAGSTSSPRPKAVSISDNVQYAPPPPVDETPTPPQPEPTPGKTPAETPIEVVEPTDPAKETTTTEDLRPVSPTDTAAAPPASEQAKPRSPPTIVTPVILVDLKRVSSDERPQDHTPKSSMEKPWEQTPKTKLVVKTKVFDNGDKYIGTFNLRGQLHGDGKYQFDNGDCYEGSFDSGKFHGHGKFVAKNGDTYVGHFKDDMYDGKGSFTDAENGDKYEGEFECGERKGFGIYTYATGDVYEGDFLNGEKHGKGKFTSADQKMTYVGDYVQGKRHGRGVFVHKNNRYEGQFRSGKMQGQGILYYENGNRYQGEFQNGEIDGKGKFTFENGNVFEGHVKRDGSFGSGKMRFFNNDVYEGEFLGRRMHGQGYLVYANGDTYEGEFDNGRKHGQGYMQINGQTREGTFIDDEFVEDGEWGRIDQEDEEED